ncbi:MAG: twin-arginine translocase TatA/TatE family subunit [Cloacibacterium sp.]|jgi:sec-independent protein translocase protein TatB|nr:twin-arginine translocase TatA/TatE family subunit [Cloacibacterium sp.]
MGDLSFGEILVVVLVIIILFGPKKIPEIARGLGQGVRKMRGAMDEIKQEIMKEADNPVSEIKKEIEKVKSQVTEATSFEVEPKEKVTQSPLDENHQGPVSR